VGEAWRLGAEGARCLGALCWQGRRGHVQPGCVLASFVELSPLTAPWLRSGVGAPKAKGRPKAKAKAKQGFGNRGGLAASASSAAGGGANALSCGNESDLGLDKRRSRLKALLGLSSSDGDVGADFDEANALRIGRGAASSGSEAGDLGDHRGTGGTAQSGLASVRGVVGVPDARRSRARALLGLSSSDDAPVPGDADKGCKFGEFGSPRGDFSDGDDSCRADGEFSK